MLKNKILVNTVIAFAIAIFVSGCASSKMNMVSSPSIKTNPVKSIAFSPNSGVLGDSIGLELMVYGFDVYDRAQFSSLMGRMNLDEFEIYTPTNLSKFNKKGIDAILSVRTVTGYDSRPDSASIKLISTLNGKLLAGGSWQNGYGGQKGSMMDRDFRSGLAEAAKEIAKALSQEMHK